MPSSTSNATALYNVIFSENNNGFKQWGENDFIVPVSTLAAWVSQALSQFTKIRVYGTQHTTSEYREDDNPGFQLIVSFF